MSADLFSRDSTPTLSLGALAMLVATGANLFAPYLIKVILDGLTPSVEASWLARVCALGVGVYALAALASYAQRILFGLATERMVAASRARVFSEVLRREPARQPLALCRGRTAAPAPALTAPSCPDAGPDRRPGSAERFRSDGTLHHLVHKAGFPQGLLVF